MICTKYLASALLLLLPTAEGAMPGTFFWRPRLGIDLAIPTTEPAITAYQPNKKNIQEGLVVLIDGYDVLTSMLGLLASVQYAADDETMNPRAAVYYTSCYRWMLRTLALFPHWLRGNFNDALAVWHSRFQYMDTTVPFWTRKLLPWVPKKSWDKEIEQLHKFRKESESAFSQFYRFPSKTFNNFNSFLPDTAEEFIFSSAVRDISSLDTETEDEKKAREDKLQQQLQHITNDAKKIISKDTKKQTSSKETKKKTSKEKTARDRLRAKRTIRL